jgi:UDP-N-acetylmuramate--alanine ligase
MLAELMRLYSTVSVTGTHGKTTTTSLLSHIFTEAGIEPTVITGGIINSWGSNARLGTGKWMIVEADESDGTFTRLPTEIGIVTNIDPEHLDYFGSVEAMHHEYAMFMKNIPFFGLAVVCIDHPVVRDMVEKLGLREDGRRLLTYGASKDADIVLENVTIDGSVTRFDAVLNASVKGGSRRLEGWTVPIPGVHNALNALAAIAVSTEAGIEDAKIKAAMGSFSGVKRRFQFTGEWNGVAIYDDYGHHPAEISAVLAAARRGAKGRVLAVVEPHRYTRVRDLFQDFSACFGDADAVIVAPLYTAGEAPIEGIDNHALASGIRTQGHKLVRSVDNAADLVPAIKELCRPGDTVVCLGAGNSTEWAHALPEWLKGAEGRAAE